MGYPPDYEHDPNKRKQERMQEEAFAKLRDTYWGDRADRTDWKLRPMGTYVCKTCNKEFWIPELGIVACPVCHPAANESNREQAIAQKKCDPFAKVTD